MNLKTGKVKRLRGSANIPGDKSISHRLLLICSLAKNKTQGTHFLPSEDCLSTLNCLQSLGVEVERPNPTTVVIEGKNLFGFEPPSSVLNVGNSGTTLRILSGILAGQSFTSLLDGDASIRKRPMKRIIEPLTLMGAEFEAREDNFVPMKIRGRPLKGIDYINPIPSAQVKSALLLAGLLAEGKTLISEPIKSRDHTERMLEFLGADIVVSDNSSAVIGKRSFEGGKIEVPGDFSSAAYLIGAALIVGDSEIIIKNVGVNPTRSGFLEILRTMGAEIELLEEREISNEPRADLLIKTSQLQGVTVQGEVIPRLIDELPLMAIIASQAEGKTIVKGAGELRVKESDRIRTTVTELKKLGASIEEFVDGFVVSGPSKLKGAVCQSYDDHRIAMSLAVAGLVAEGETTVQDSECVDTSFPGFEQTLKSIIQ